MALLYWIDNRTSSQKNPGHVFDQRRCCVRSMHSDLRRGVLQNYPLQLRFHHGVLSIPQYLGTAPTLVRSWKNCWWIVTTETNIGSRMFGRPIRRIRIGKKHFYMKRYAQQRLLGGTLKIPGQQNKRRISSCRIPKSVSGFRGSKADIREISTIVSSRL